MDKNNNHTSAEIEWSEFEQLQKCISDKLIYYNTAIKFFKEVFNEVNRHQINLTLINNNNFKANLKYSSKLDDLFENYKEIMKQYTESNKRIIIKIIKSMNNFCFLIKKDNSIFTEFKQIFSNYHLQLKKFNQNKDKFLEAQLDVEKKILKKVEKNELNKNDLQKKVKEKIESHLKKYQSSIEETNKIREDYKSKRNSLINYYNNIEKKEITIYNTFYNKVFKKEKENIFKYYFNTMSKIELDRKNCISKELDDIKKKIEKNKKKEINLKFEYKTNINFESCLENNNFNAYIETVDIIKKIFNNTIYNDINIEDEKIKNNLRDILKQFFQKDNEINENAKIQYFNLLKNPLTHRTFLKILTKLRTNSGYKIRKELIDLFEQSFIIILEEAEKNQNLSAAKNCLILSQTFYYEEKGENGKINKIYPFEKLKNENTWLKKRDFWLRYCEWMIDEELKKFISLFDDISIQEIKEKKNFSEKVNIKIGNIIFAQLLPSLPNMLEIVKNKINAIEIIEIFKQNYIYLSKENINGLLDAISSNKDEIEELLNEYRKNIESQQSKNKTIQFNEIANKEQINYNKIIINNKDKENDSIEQNNNLENHNIINDNTIDICTPNNIITTNNNNDINTETNNAEETLKNIKDNKINDHIGNNHDEKQEKENEQTPEKPINNVDKLKNEIKKEEKDKNNKEGIKEDENEKKEENEQNENENEKSNANLKEFVII